MAFALRQFKENFSSATPLQVSFSSGILAGSVILVSGFFDTSVTFSSLGDGGDTVQDSGNGLVNGHLTGSGIFVDVFIKGFLAPTAGATTVTLNMSGNPVIADLAIWEVTGGTNVVFDGKAAAAANSGAGTTADTGATATLASATEFGVCYGVPDNSFSSQGTGWTLDSIPPSLGTLQEHMVISATTPIHGLGVLNTTGQDYVIAAATIMSTVAAGPPTGWMSAADELPRRRYVPGYDVGLLPIAPRPQFLAQGIAVELPPRRRLILPEEPTFAQPPAAGTPTPSVLWNAPDDNPRPKKPPLDPGAPLPLFQASTIVAPPNGWQSPVDDLPRRRPVNTEAGLLPLPPAPVLLFLVPGDHPLPPARRPPTDAAGLQQQVTFTPVSGMAWAGTPGDNVVSRPLTWLLSSTAFSPQVIAPPPPPPSGVHYITTSRGKLIAVIGVS